MQTFYVNKEELEALYLSKEESLHCVKVLRKNTGDTIYLLNGVGDLITAEIIEANHKKCAFKIINTERQINSNPSLHICIAPPKSIDRFDIFIEKAIELGIKEITPIFSEHSERRKLNIEKLQKQLIVACKQSLTYHFPILNEPKTFKEILSSSDNYTNKLIGHCNLSYERHPIISFDTSEDSIVLIGPEGDFSIKEIDSASERGFKAIKLNNKRLRTETAGIAIVAIWNFL